MNVAVAIMPTKRTVDCAWERYRALCLKLRAAPALMTDRNFAEQITEAEAEWQRIFADWVRRAA